MADSRLAQEDEQRKIAKELVTRTQALLDRVVFMDMELVVTADARGEVYMQGQYHERDTYTKKMTVQKTRRWLLSPPMSDSSIVKTAFMLCMTSMEHRTREAFTYKGERVFGPHFDVEDMVRLCKAGADAKGGGHEPPKSVPETAAETLKPVEYCSTYMRFQGKAYPRTCLSCGLGSCKYYNSYAKGVLE